MLVVKLTSVLGTTPDISFAGYSGGLIHFPAGLASTQVDVYASADPAGIYTPLYDAIGNAVTFTVSASSSRVLPAAVFPCKWLRFKTNADDSALDVTIVRKG